MVASSNHSSFLVPLVHLSSSQPVYALPSASQFRTLSVPLRKDPLGRSASRRSTFGPRLLPRDWIVTSKYRSDVLVIPPSGNLELVPLSSETATRVNALAKRRQQIIPSGRSRDGHLWEETLETRDDSFLEVLYETWALVGEPIAKKFEESGILGSGLFSANRVWWCLTSYGTVGLSFLSMHVFLDPLRLKFSP